MRNSYYISDINDLENAQRCYIRRVLVFKMHHTYERRLLTFNPFPRSVPTRYRLAKILVLI